MKYKIFLSLIFLTCFHITAVAQAYQIEGNVKGISDNTLYLTLIGPKLIDIDSTTSKNGLFNFHGPKVTDPKFYCIRIKGKFSPILSFFLDNGKTLIQGELYKDVYATGTPINDAFTEYIKILYPLNEKHYKLQYNISTSVSKSLDDKVLILKDSLASLNKMMFQVTKGLIKKNRKSAVALQILKDRVPFMSVDEIELVISELDSQTFSGNKEVIAMKDRALNMKNAEIGRMAPEINLLDSAGKQISLSSLKGKIVLIDFWASWCVPCRAENPNVKNAYEQYVGKGFMVLGISLDRQNEPWKNAMKKDGLKWLNVIDPQGETAKRYAVLSIPQNFLIDANGKILAIGLRGKELQQKLKSIL